MKPLFSFFHKKYIQIKNFFVGDSNEENNLSDFTFFTLENLNSESYINFDLTVEQKIEFEKRRRYQAYTTLDYMLSIVSYFDFFSLDCFQITEIAKELSQLFSKKVVSSDLLLLPFFTLNSQLLKIFEKYGITEKMITEIICLANINEMINETFLKEQTNKIKNFLINIDIPLLSESIIQAKETKLSREISSIFEKAAENALTRFKTPVITSEILLITMLEAKNTRVGKLLKLILKNDTNWHTFRYSLMKNLHSQELKIRTDVPKNQHYFAYLLKTQLSEVEFETLMDKDYLLSGVSLFRNNLISKVIKVDLATVLKDEVKLSLKKSKTRKYSS